MAIPASNAKVTSGRTSPDHPLPNLKVTLGMTFWILEFDARPRNAYEMRPAKMRGWMQQAKDELCVKDTAAYAAAMKATTLAGRSAYPHRGTRFMKTSTEKV